jgi:glutathione S-transferase
MTRAYGVREGVKENATARVIGILQGLSRQLARSRAAGSEYLVGASLTAADVYWACFAILIEPLPDAICPMSPEMRAVYANITPEIAAAADPSLLAHRDMVWQRHIGLPMQF